MANFPWKDLLPLLDYFLNIKYVSSLDTNMKRLGHTQELHNTNLIYTKKYEAITNNSPSPIFNGCPNHVFCSSTH